MSGDSADPLGIWCYQKAWGCLGVFIFVLGMKNKDTILANILINAIDNVNPSQIFSDPFMAVWRTIPHTHVIFFDLYESWSTEIQTTNTCFWVFFVLGEFICPVSKSIFLWYECREKLHEFTSRVPQKLVTSASNIQNMTQSLLIKSLLWKSFQSDQRRDHTCRRILSIVLQYPSQVHCQLLEKVGCQRRNKD